MASDNEASCESDPNFAVICAFMEKFGVTCGLTSIDFLELQEMLENTQEVPQELIDLHIKLLRKSRKTVSNERWEKAIIKFCHGFCVQDAWEIERFGYKKARLSSKLRVLKELLEMQFDYNVRFKAEINKMSAEELRSQPLGKDKQGHAYWFQNDNNCQIRVYKEDPDEETWTLVAKDRDGLVSLINELSAGDSTLSTETVINEEDSNSLVEKPIIDTGQVDSSSSDSNKSNNSSESTKKENISDENSRIEESEEETKKLDAKRPREESDVEDEEETKKAKPEISEAIEEPLMLVKGEGNGEENNCVNPIIGEEIEEDVLYFYGCGNGEDCSTGNEDKTETKQSETSDGTSESSEKSTPKNASDSDNFVSISVKSDAKNCDEEEEVPTSPVKNPYKLGTIIDTKTDNKFFNTIRSPTKKSRWDVETIMATETNCLKSEETEEEETTPKKSIFFFGRPGCLQFKPNVSPVSCSATVAFGQKVPQTNLFDDESTKNEETCENQGQEVIPSKTKGDIGYRISEKSDDNIEETEETIECVQSEKDSGEVSVDGKIEETQRVDQETPIESKVDTKLDKIEETKAEEVSSQQTTEEVVEESTKTELVEEPAETEDNKAEHDSEEISHTPPKSEEIDEKTDTLAAIEKEIVSEDYEITAEEAEIPEVTATLVEYKEEKAESTKVETEATAVVDCTKETADTTKVEKGESAVVDCKEETADSTKVEEEATAVVDCKEETADTTKVEKEETAVVDCKEKTADSTKVKKEETAVVDCKEETADTTKLEKEETTVADCREEAADSTQLEKEETIVADCKEEAADSTKVEKEKTAVVECQAETADSTKVEKEETIVINEPVPVIEEKCVKKEAYLLGGSEEEEEKSKVNNSIGAKDNEINSNHQAEGPVEKIEETETKDNQIIEEESNCFVAAKEEEIVNSKNEEKDEIEVKETTNNKTRGGRKNNISDEQPKAITRRSTRSSKNEEQAEKTKLTETSELSQAVKEVKEKSPPKEESVAPPPRRGRSRGMRKKEEIVEEDDGSKKMKMEPPKTEENVEEDDGSKKIKVGPPKSEEIVEEGDDSKKLKIGSPKSEEIEEEPVTVESSNSSDVVESPDKDPLAVSEEEIKEKEEKPAMSLATFSLDFNESPTPTPPLTRSGLRKRGRESPQNADEIEETAGKRLKKGKRNIDVKLRKSIEEQKKQELISSDDDNKNDQSSEQTEEKPAKKKGSKHKKPDDDVVVSSDPEEDKKEAEPIKKKTKSSNKNKRLLSNLGIDPDKPLGFGEEITVGVRQSRRIAQLKIKEEAERRKLEEDIVHEHRKKKKSKKHEDKDYKVEKKILKNDEEEEEDDSGDSKKKKKKKKKKKQRKLFDELNPWRSSSDSSTTDEEEEEEIVEDDEDDEVLQYVSDHEFSPESDMEGDGEALPLKRARTARKESEDEEVDDCPCQKCGKSDHPEWILLCDRCDNGWHCSCLRPPLLVIPEGDWFCPPCQHVTLLKKLQEKLKDYDKKLSKKEIEDRRKQRLAYVGISLNSVLPTKDAESMKKRRRNSRGEEDDDAGGYDDEESSSSSGDESGSGSGTESGSDSDEPIYQLRQRRQAHSYRFNDYDDLINSAIQDEMDAVKGAGNQGRGKDISTIVNAEKEEKIEEEPPPELEPLPPVVPPDDKDKEAKPLYSDDEPVVGVRKKIIGRKKHRKLNSLDISSADDDADSDEDFKGTSSESEDDFDDDLGSEDSDDLGGRGRRRNLDPVRRSTRARTSRYDADFIDDGDSDDEDAAPRRKKKRSIWDDSESEESDRSWGRRKRKPVNRAKKSTPPTTKKKKSKKKKKDNDDSDAEVYRKKKPKIKFGLDGDDEGPGRRTRGKKINYVDALGSDSDEDRVKRPPPRIESEEEYVANEDEEFDEDDKATDEESGEDKAPKVQIQSYADARFTQLLPEGVPTPKDLYSKNPILEDGEGELNPIDQINRNVEMMDENEMEKMMEEEEYANKQLQMVALQLEKEKRRKEREAKKLEGLMPPQLPQREQGTPKKRGRKPKNQFQFSGAIQEPLVVGNVDNLLLNSENNDELSEPPGVSLPMFADLGGPGDGLDDPSKKRSRGRGKKSLEEAVANLGSTRQQESAAYMRPTDLSVQETNIEIAAPPQPFSQSQPTPSVITRMLQSKPGQPGYPIGAIRPKQFASMSDREDEVPTSHHSMSPAPAHLGQYLPGTGLRPQLSSPYRQMPPNINHYPRGAPPPPPHQIRNPVPHLYHSHRPMDPSPSGGGTINISEHNSPGRVVSPAASSPGSNKNETPPPPYSRPPPVGRFPMITTTSAGPRHLPMVAPPHLQPPRPNLSPYHPSMPPSYHYGQFGQPPMGEDAMPPTVYQSSPYSEQFPEGQVNQSENSNSKSFDEESGGEFGGLVSYFSSQREDDLES